MTDDGRDHSWDGGDGFEEDGSVEDFVLGDFAAVPSGGFGWMESWSKMKKSMVSIQFISI